MKTFIVQTIIIDNNKKFNSKKEFKNYYIENYVPIEKDPLREFNLKIMNKYGHDNFFLTFVKPNIGILTHKYFTEEEYNESINLRDNQKKLMKAYNIDYLISEVLIQDEDS